jgi:glycosyltransferase involved in cell wall biosynthesis
MIILYVATQDNPLDPTAGSGADYEFYRAFVQHGAEVRIIGPFQDRPSVLEKAYRKGHRLFSSRRYAKHSVAFLRQISRAVSEVIASDPPPDVIFSISTMGLALCPSTVPLISRLDTSLKGHEGQYPIFSKLEARRMMGWERKALGKLSLVITYSDWNADILTSFYQVPRKKILVVAVPASLPEAVVGARVDGQPLAMQPLHLLLVGRNIHRKGLDIAIEAVHLLNMDGVPAELHVVGLTGEADSNVRYMGIFRKDVPSELWAYADQYRWAHFLLHPARFEAGGIAVSEAAAFGLPAITNAAGGLATTVKHGVSGIVLPARSPGRAYADAIRPFLDNPAGYLALRRSTRQRFEEELNWDVTGDKIFRAFENTVGARRQNAVVATQRQG